MELTNALRKTIQSLDTVKGRRATSLFMAEGTKCVLELIPFFKLNCLIATSDWVDQHKIADIESDNVIVSGRGEIRKISRLTTPRDVIAVFEIPESGDLPCDLTERLEHGRAR